MLNIRRINNLSYDLELLGVACQEEVFDSVPMSLHGLILPFLVHFRYLRVEYRWQYKLILNNALFLWDFHCLEWSINLLVKDISHEKIHDFSCEVIWEILVGVHTLKLLDIFVRKGDDSGLEDLDVDLCLEEI